MQPKDQRDAIAALPGNLGYRLLLSDIEITFEDILANLASANTDEQVVRYGRLFQVFWKMRSLLSTTPEKFREEISEDLNEIRRLTPLDPTAPPFPPHRAALLHNIEKGFKLD